MKIQENWPGTVDICIKIAFSIESPIKIILDSQNESHCTRFVHAINASNIDRAHLQMNVSAMVYRGKHNIIENNWIK